jgi:GR25 family glycosyltransferase involved in LPS biosynthesis
MLSVEARMLKHGSVRCTVFLAPDVDVETYQTYVKSNPKFQFVHLQHDSVHVEGFDDFWTPTHYAWKPYILQRVNADPAYAGTLCFYNDCGMAVLDEAVDYLKVARDAGLCFLEDGRQTNRMWCHAEFCRALGVSEAEADARQIWAGAFAFVAGSALATAVLDEAWTWAQRRSVIVGEKWLGKPDASGCYGHRHDQSIYSIVGRRKGAGFYPLDLVYNDHSMFLAQKQGCALYVHRGGFKLKAPVFEGIDEVRLINLERRTDRLEKFRAAHPEWHHRVCVEKAVDGRALTLTTALAALFKPNDFLWKKAIMGCALSHLKVWKKLAEDNTIGSMLVLEDDVLFKGDFLSRWPAAARTVPADWDVLYLGGVLPPNKAMYEKMVEPVNAHWGRIKENQVFGQRVANRYFHFCNYSYVLRRSAAVKLLASIESRGGYHTSADHMICNAVDLFKHYVLRPAAAGCYQDDDPKYANSEFNNFNRVDGFDSDLWNNDERFSKEEIDGVSVSAGAGVSVSASAGLVDAALNDIKPVETHQPIMQVPENPKNLVIYTVGPHDCEKLKNVKEYDWIFTLLNGTLKPEDIGTARQHEKRYITLKHIEDVAHEPLDCTPLFLVQIPHMQMYEYIFHRYNAAGKKFKVLHLSDEFGKDPIEWVKLDSCVSVLRNYPRPDLEDSEKVRTIPLGWAQSSGEREAPWQQTPSLPFREYTWSFYGTRWAGRDMLLEPLKSVGPHKYTLFDTWNDPNQLGTIEYLGSMLNSVFVACPGGQNAETFRFYEALECGAIPLVVRRPGDDGWWAMVAKYINLAPIYTWLQAPSIIEYFMKNKEMMEKYRLSILAGWMSWKADCRSHVKKFLEA